MVEKIVLAVAVVSTLSDVSPRSLRLGNTEGRWRRERHIDSLITTNSAADDTAVTVGLMARTEGSNEQAPTPLVCSGLGLGWDEEHIVPHPETKDVTGNQNVYLTGSRTTKYEHSDNILMGFLASAGIIVSLGFCLAVPCWASRRHVWRGIQRCRLINRHRQQQYREQQMMSGVPHAGPSAAVHILPPSYSETIKTPVRQQTRYKPGQSSGYHSVPTEAPPIYTSTENLHMRSEFHSETGQQLTVAPDDTPISRPPSYTSLDPACHVVYP